jgi:hypothetical protein
MQAQGHSEVISIASKNPKIDGIIDANDPWVISDWIDIAQLKGSNDGMSAQYQLKYDKDSLYMAVKVIDGDRNTGYSSTYQNDCIEFFIALDTTSLINGAYKTGDFQIRKQADDAIPTDGSVTQTFTHIKVVDNGDNYVQEWAIPWEDLSNTMDPAWEQDQFKFDIQVANCTSPGSRTQQQFWNSNSDEQWHNTKYFGLITLETPIPAISAPACSGKPAPGNTLSTSASICAGINFTLSLQNNVYADGLTYQWQSSPNNSTWTPIAGATKSRLKTTQTASTYYRCVVTCTNSAETTNSNPAQVTMKTYTDCYCTPPPTEYGCNTYHITNVTTIGGTTNINNETDCSINNYADYSSTKSASFVQLSDATISLTSSNNTSAFSVWIDFNDNGLFEAPEQVIAKNSNGAANTVSQTFTIPETAAPGSHRMRIRSDNYGQGTPSNPCSRLQNGETEDYNFIVIAATPCSGAPNPGNTVPSANSVCSGINFDLSLQNFVPESGLTYQWQTSSNNSLWNDMAGATSAKLTTSQTEATYYRCQVTCSNSSTTVASNAIQVAMNSPTSCYCTPPTPYNTCYTYITNIATTGGAVNFTNSTSCTTASYTNYSSTKSATYSQLEYATINFITSNAAAIAVWIDFNDNGIFELSEKVIAEANSDMLSSFSSSFLVPVTATPGTHRMRVRGERYIYGTPTDPCNKLQYGETEDYAFTVTATTACSGAPTPGNTVSSAASICPNANFSLSLQNYSPQSGMAYQWQSSANNSTWNDILGATSARLTTSQTAATYYRCQVTCSAGPNTTTSTAIQVTMNAPTDCYCTPPTSYTNCNMYFASVSTSGGTENFTNSTSCSSTSYTNYFNTKNATFAQLTYATISYTTQSNPGAIAIWIDYNDDGIFEGTEKIFSFSNSSRLYSNSFTFKVPVSAAPGKHRMRIRGDYFGYGLINDPCNQLQYGETEDYAFTVVSAPSCAGIPAPGNTISSETSVCPGINFNLSLQNYAPENGLTYQWQASSDNSNWVDISGATEDKASLNQTVATYYRCKITCLAGPSTGYSTSVRVTMNDAFLCLNEIKVAPKPPVTDGFIDSKDPWVENHWRKIDKANAGNTLGNMTAQFQLMYDKNYLYCAAKVMDDTRFTGYSMTYSNDCIEIFLSMDTTSGNGTYKVGDLFLRKQANNEILPDGSVSPTYADITNIDNGNDYVQEWAIPWADLTKNMSPAWDQKQFKFDIKASNATSNGARTQQMFWNDNSDFQWNNTTKLGVIKLEKPLTEITASSCNGTPVPGNTLTSKNNVCPGVTFELSLQNKFYINGMSYQWQSSTDMTNWGNISNATNSKLRTTQQKATYYRCLVTCSDGQSSGYSVPLQVMMNNPIAVVKKASVAPVVDGTIDAIWESANTYSIDKKYLTENPSLGASGSTSWKALWGSAGIYVLIQVNDDVYSPAYLAGTRSGQTNMYDRPEIYFDVNKVLRDGYGSNSGSGHYQVAPIFVDGKTDGTPVTGTDGVVNAFKVTNSTYVAEYYIPFSKLMDKNGNKVNKADTIGFDITIIDNDVADGGVSIPNRNRAVWANTGNTCSGTDESLYNMDGCGSITLEGVAPEIELSSPTSATFWQSGTLQELKWANTKITQSEKVQYSLNSGADWIDITTIASPVNGANKYSWTIPTVTGINKNAMVRVISNDGAYSAISSCTISDKPRIEFVQPSLGNIITSGNNYQLSITNIGETIDPGSYIRLDLSTNGGSSWFTSWYLDETLPKGLNYYDLFIDPIISASKNCKFRVGGYDANYNFTEIARSNVFEIQSAPPSISIVEPMENYYWESDSVRSIVWYSTNVNQQEKIQYSIDGGSNWTDITTIASPIKGQNSYKWTVAKVTGIENDAMIRVISNDLTISGSSLQFFISNKPQFEFVQPTTGTVWKAGEDYNIALKNNGAKSESFYNGYGLEISENGSTKWQTIKNLGYSIASGLSYYACIIPASLSPSANTRVSLVRLDWDTIMVSKSSSFETTLADISLTMAEPNVNSYWLAGTKKNIEWTGTHITAVKIEYTINNGSTWNTLQANYTAVNGINTYEWTIPNITLTNEARVRISDANVVGGTVVESDLFTISSYQKQMAIISPNGGEQWIAGNTYPITIENRGSKWDYMYIYYTNNGTMWNNIGYKNDILPGKHIINWQIPSGQAPLSTYKIMFEAHKYGSSSLLSDTSDLAFTIVAPTINLSVTSPISSDYWPSGTVKTISWNSTGISSVKIEYSLDGGIAWSNVATGLAAVDGNNTYSWTIPTVANIHNNARIRISSSANATIQDVSDLFSIATATPYISIISPNGGEHFVAGKDYIVKFENGGSYADYFRFYYSIDNGSNWISSDYFWNVKSGQNQYNWTVPSTVSTSGNCLVKLTNNSNTVSKTSDNVFTIDAAAPTFTISNPSLDAWYGSGENLTIGWTNVNNNTTAVNIYYSIDGGTNWISIKSNQSSNEGYNNYDWKIATVTSITYIAKIKVEDASNTSIFAESKLFTINSVPVSLTINSPNGGEQFNVGEKCNIQFTFTGKTGNSGWVYYSTNNGLNWNYVGNPIIVNGLNSYNWQIPADVNPSTNCLIRISAYKNDTSNAVFEIRNPTPHLSLQTPNGMVTWQSGTQHNIEWQSTNITTVDILYSNDGGINWVPVSSGITSVNGNNSISWTVPSLQLSNDNCKIKIVSATPSLKVIGSAFTITSNNPTPPIVETVTQPTCALPTGSIVLKGLPATGTWTLTRTPGSITTTGSGVSTTISGLDAGVYTYTVTNASALTSVATANISIIALPATPAIPTVGAITHPTCTAATGSVSLSGLPAGTWTINPGATAGSTTSGVVSGLAAGNHTFTVTNASGCISKPTANVVINAQPVTSSAPIVGSITQPTCTKATGSVVLNGLPSGNWTINPGAISGSTASITITGVEAGTTKFTVTNAVGCTSPASANVVITALPNTNAPTIGTVTQPTCSISTGSIELTGLPSGNWTINPGAITGNTTSITVSKLGANTYNYTVTNANGCISSTSDDVVINAQPATPVVPTIGTITQPTCTNAKGSVVLSSLPSGNWIINPGAITGSTSSATISNLVANTYNYTVTNAAGCTSGATANVVINAQPETPAVPTVGNITQPTCNVAKGFVVLSGLPSGNWIINPGAIIGNSASATISELNANTYNFTVTNAVGCTSVASANIVINPQPNIPTAPIVGTITQPTCILATGSVNISGLPSGNWTINPGAITGSTATTSISGLAANKYNFTVTSENGCISALSADVVIEAKSVPAKPTITLKQNILHSDATSGNQWYNKDGLIPNVIGQDYTVTTKGDYYVIVTSSGCSSSASNTISVTPTAVNLASNTTITVYPNPMSDELILEMAANKNKINFEITNSLGQVVYKNSFYEKTKLKTSQFESGVYYIKLGDGKFSEIKKVVKK